VCKRRLAITGLFVNQCESLLLQLSYSHHCVGVDLYSGKEVFIGPVVSCGSGTAQFDLYALLHQPGDELSIGIPGFDWMTGLNTTIGVALCVPATAVLERSSPPALWTVQREGDPSWQATIDALITLGTRLAVIPASFGSLLWQQQTGLQYLSRQSDIDVLWCAHRECDVLCLLAGIAGIQRTAPMRIDGEVVFANGDAVNWRELHACLDGEEPEEVLAKSIDGVRLVNVAWLQDLQRAA
jgi:malonate decarboxylase holo-[acyl-carrier-protein] synthase